MAFRFVQAQVPICVPLSFERHPATTWFFYERYTSRNPDAVGISGRRNGGTAAQYW
jgi:hypothetical protein